MGKILCVSNAYDKKYYLNPEFNGLPQSIKEDLQVLCVLYTEDIGGILTLEFDDEGNLLFTTASDDGDILYDEIGSVLKVNHIKAEKREFLESLEMYYKVFVLGLPMEDED